LTFKRTAVVALLILILLHHDVYSQRTKSSLSAGSQRHAEKSLKDSRYFFYFINTSVSNTGTEEEKQIFTEALRRDILSRMLYMKFAFTPAMGEVIKTQQLLVKLFSIIAIREIDDVKKLINENAPEILKSKCPSAKKYMSLGYRSADWALKLAMMSDNLPDKNYSIKIYEYVKAIKNAKYGKRYAIISLIESRIPAEKRGRINYNKYKTVKELVEKYIPENKEKYLFIHSDNFYKIASSESLYDKIVAAPGLETIPEYTNYIKEN
jgi:hypothetical protein